MNELLITDSEFKYIIENIIKNDTVQKMKNYRQHYDTSCFDHCYEVSYHCFKICKKYNLDYISATRAAMLHDLFLYDWRKKRPNQKGLHAFTHGKEACQNACKLFELNEKEKDMIIKHMWPLTFALPKSPEGFILTFVDKYCTLSEALNVYKNRLYALKAFRYTYLLLSLLFLPI